MDRFEVIFANCYLTAVAAKRTGQPATQSWTRRFQATDWGYLVILQHLLLGLSTHINLDLGIAAANLTRS